MRFDFHLSKLIAGRKMTSPANISAVGPRRRSLSVNLASGTTLNVNARPFTPELPIIAPPASPNTRALIQAEVAEAAATPIVDNNDSSEAHAVGSVASLRAWPGGPGRVFSTNGSLSFPPPAELDAISTEVAALPVANVVNPVSDPVTGSETDDGNDGSVKSGTSRSSSATLAPDDPEAEATATQGTVGPSGNIVVTYYFAPPEMDGEMLAYEPPAPMSVAITPSAGSTDLPSPTSTNSTSTRSDPVWSYHRDADLLIKVNDSKGLAYFKVCSALIAAASPVWRQMIYGGDHQHQEDDGKWIVHMTGHKDRAFGLHILFSIIHYQFSEVPETPTLDQYHDLATVASHYDCCQLLIPYAKNWVNSYELRSKYNSQPDGKIDEKLMRIYWALGAGFLFVRLLDRVANTATISPTGAFVNHEGKIWARDDPDLPANVIDDMIAIRFSKVERLLNTVREPADTLISNPELGSRFCKSKSKDAKLLCHNMQLGSLMTGLNSAGLLPVPRAEEYRGNVYDLETKLSTVKVMGYKTAGALPHQDPHASCGIDHKSLIKEIMEHPGKPSDLTIGELRINGMKCGTFGRDLYAGVIPGFDGVGTGMDLRSNHAYYRQREEDLVEEYLVVSNDLNVPAIIVDAPASAPGME